MGVRAPDPSPSWRSLEVENLEEESAFVAELERRAAEMQSGVAKGLPWEELWAELKRERGGS
jgi:putative addiction module component